MDTNSTAAKRLGVFATVLAMMLAAGSVAYFSAGPVAPAQTNAVRGTASLTGTVTSTMAFKAAQVYIRNTEKRMLYMVKPANSAPWPCCRDSMK